MPKTPAFTLRLDPDLRAELQAIADAEHRALGNLIEVALRQWLAAQEAGKHAS